MATDFNKYFYYDKTSRTGLRWRTDRRCGRGQSGSIVAYKNAPAGTLQSTGYFTTNILGKTEYNHRIIWLMEGYLIPRNHEIDHIDGDRSNNNIENLRCVSRAKNSRNAVKRKTNKSGVNAVCESVYSWAASWWTLDRKRKQKSFSKKIYGNEEAFRLACEYRDKMIAELNECGAGYSERHGKESNT